MFNQIDNPKFSYMWQELVFLSKNMTEALCYTQVC